MQNKGFIKVLAGALILVCLFYLSFSFVTNYYSNKAKEYAKGDIQKEYYFLDSLSANPVWLGYTLKECREKEINLGLDLKGGMNVTLEVSVPDIIKALSNNNSSENFNKAMTLAQKRQASSQADFLTLFEQAYKEIDPNARLSTIFSTYELKDKIPLNASNEDVMKVLRAEVEAAVSNSFNVLRTRIDRFGVVQPNIQRLETTGRILIELPGIKEPERVRKLLQGTANLEFWETYELKEITDNLVAVNTLLKSTYTPTIDSTVQAEDTSAVSVPVKKSAQQLLIDSLKSTAGAKTQTTTSDEATRAQREKENPLFSILQLNLTQNGQPADGAIVGVAHFGDTSKINKYLNSPQVKTLLKSDLTFKWGVKAIDDKEQVFQLYAIKITNTAEKKAPLEGDVITDASSDFGQYSSYATVNMQMDPDGANIWARLTEQNIGRSIAIVLDGYVYSAPRVNDKIPGGRSEITGNFTVEEAKDLANVLKSGRMPAPTRIVQEDVVGPTLGQESIEKGLMSFAIAFVLIMLYMMLYYGLVPGIIANISLLGNVFLLLAILASFKGVLTLPGIAGIVLTLGMAVDTNVLIYERAREELRMGKNPQNAIKEGYSQSASAIIDANLTSMLTGIVLFIFGTGPIKGFATTLIIGIITSLITGFVLSRFFYDFVFKSDKLNKKLTFSTKVTKNWFSHPTFDFIGKRKLGYIISGTIILIGTVSLFTNGLNQGIDFSGGRNYIVSFDNKVETEELRNLLSESFDGEALSVITIKSNEADKGDNRVRITTNFKIGEQSHGIDDEIHTRLYNGLKPVLGGVSKDEFINKNIISSQKVGPAIADDIKNSAVWAMILSILGIGLYIFIRFRNIAFSLGAIFSLAHDAFIIIICYSLFYKIMPFALEVDQSFVAAILTIIGFSVNDTVVIFDRIREYKGLYPNRPLKELLNDSLNTTLGRTFSTSFTVLLVLLCILFLGGDVIRGFMFALVVGTVAGSYSTLFLAVPVVFETMIRGKKKNKKDLGVAK